MSNSPHNCIRVSVEDGPATGKTRFLVEIQRIASTLGLAVVRGFTPALYARVAADVVALPADAGVNVNTAPAEVLAVALPSLDSEAIAAIVAARRERPYTTLEDFRARTARGTATADTTGLSVGSRHFLVTVVARQGHAVARAQALVARSDGQRSSVIWQVVD